MPANTSPITPLVVLTPSEAAVLNDFNRWLDDNIAMNSEICFDSEGNVTSKEVASVMNRILPVIDATTTQSVEQIQTELSDYIQNVEQKIVATCEVESYEQVNVEFYEETEDFLIGTAESISEAPELAQAIATLYASGHSNIADYMKDIVKLSADISHLTETGVSA